MTLLHKADLATNMFTQITKIYAHQSTIAEKSINSVLLYHLGNADVPFILGFKNSYIGAPIGRPANKQHYIRLDNEV